MTQEVEFDTIKLVNFESTAPPEAIPKTVKVFGTKIQRPLDFLRGLKKEPKTDKEYFLIEGARSEHRGKIFEAVVQYSHALDQASKMGANDEINVLDSKIKSLMVRLPIKQQIAFLKYRQSLGAEKL